MRILITGGAGFIGSHTAETLLAHGLDVRVLDDFSTGSAANLATVRDRLELIEGDMRDPATLAAAVQGCQAILHLAAVVSVPVSIDEPMRAHDINATGTLLVLEAARAHGVSRVVVASSAAVYGASDHLPLHEDVPLEPLSPYAVQKLFAEHCCQVYARLHGISAIALRYFNVYGPRQDPASPYSGVLSRFAAAVLEERAPTIFGDGRQTRDFLYVKDVAQANMLALTAPDEYGGTVLNVATGKARSVNEAFDVIARLEDAPPELQAIYKPAREGEVRFSQAHIGRARQLLGYQPRTGFPEGLARTLAWLRLRGATAPAPQEAPR